MIIYLIFLAICFGIIATEIFNGDSDLEYY